ncbi:MAG: class I SAM-dependent methyltransferase [Cyanobacteria bacterium Co-bin13]|nr:class I SAM-dependent methyltransferase [Cyanobacteria bacterium Co-bin13]
MAISFDRAADFYDQTRALPPEVADRVTECILQLSQARPETSFFEPGVGTGRIALPLVERGYAYTGADISEQMMDKLRQKLAGKPHRLTLVNADITTLPFEAEVFDAAIAAHILHLVANWRQALAEILRVLKPQGVLIYFHHPGSGATRKDPIDQQWRTILERHGYRTEFVGAGTEDVLDYFQAQNLSLETVTVAQVARTRTVAEAVQTYCDRIYSHLWQIPEPIFAPAIEELKTWVPQTYPDLEEQFESTFEVTVTAASKAR